MMNVQHKFLEDLNAILDRYNVIISCDDHWTGYAECGKDLRIAIEFEDYSIGDVEFGNQITPQQVIEKIKEIK